MYFQSVGVAYLHCIICLLQLYSPMWSMFFFLYNTTGTCLQSLRKYDFFFFFLFFLYIFLNHYVIIISRELFLVLLQLEFDLLNLRLLPCNGHRRDRRNFTGGPIFCCDGDSCHPDVDHFVEPLSAIRSLGPKSATWEWLAMWSWARTFPWFGRRLCSHLEKVHKLSKDLLSDVSGEWNLVIKCKESPVVKKKIVRWKLSASVHCIE